MTRPQDQARKAYAAALERKGPAWANSASSVRAGYTNVWIDAAIDALSVLVLIDDDPDDD